MAAVNATPTWALEPTFDGPGLMYLDKSLDWLVDKQFIAGQIVFYIAMNVFLQSFMKDRKPMTQLKSVMQVYNVVQIALCAYMAWGLTIHMHLMAPALSVNAFGYQLSLPNIFGLNVKYNAGIEYFVFVHYLSKFLDYFDTIFIILRKSDHQLSFLHVFHHATIGPVWGFLLHLGHGNGTVGYGAYINSVIHVIMYTHYLVTSFGIKHPFKKYITQCQITQFVSCEVHAFMAIFSGFEKQLPGWLAWMQVAYHVTMIALFTDFYFKTIAVKNKSE